MTRGGVGVVVVVGGGVAGGNGDGGGGVVCVWRAGGVGLSGFSTAWFQQGFTGGCWTDAWLDYVAGISTVNSPS